MSEVSKNYDQSFEEAGEPLALLLTKDSVIVHDNEITLTPDEVTVIEALAANPGVYLGSRQLQDLGYFARKSSSDRRTRSDVISGILKQAADKLNAEEDIIRSVGTTFVARYMMLADVQVSRLDERVSDPRAKHYHVHNRYWRDEAKCLDANPEIFTEAAGMAARTVIAAYCEHCPVRDDCLAAAVIAGDKVGVKGGLTGKARIPHIRAYNKYVQQNSAL